MLNWPIAGSCVVPKEYVVECQEVDLLVSVAEPKQKLRGTHITSSELHVSPLPKRILRTEMKACWQGHKQKLKE